LNAGGELHPRDGVTMNIHHHHASVQGGNIHLQ
jgi:hypothetical protein